MKLFLTTALVLSSFIVLAADIVPINIQHLIFERELLVTESEIPQMTSNDLKIITTLSDNGNIQIELPVVNPAEHEAIEQPIVTFDVRPPADLLAEAKQLISGDGPYDTAFDDLRSILLLPINENTRDAHEMLGYAYQKNGQIEKAKAEYALYLRLYPEPSTATTRVRQRLLNLEIQAPPEKIDLSKDRKPHIGKDEQFQGSVSEYYYTGSTTPSASSAWHTDQSSTMTNIQLAAKYVDNEYTITSKFRYSDLKDFLHPDNGRSITSMAYIDAENTYDLYNLRIGRQPQEAGSISRFDGISARYRLNDKVRFTAAFGSPYISPYETSKRQMQGVEVDYTFSRSLLGNAYINRGTVDGLTEREAVGTGIDYFNSGNSASFRFEYDALYRAINLMSIQGTVALGDYNIYGLMERRRSPMLFADSALVLGMYDPTHRAYSSINDMLTRSGLSSSDIYSFISGSTPIANSYVLGFSKPISEKWTLSSNVQISNLTSTQGFNISPQFTPVPVSVGMSNSYSVNLQMRGENAIVKDNVLEGIATATTGSMNSDSLTFADSLRFGSNNKDTISIMLRHDTVRQQTITVGTTYGMIRTLFRMSDNGMIEMQYARSITNLSAMNTVGSQPIATNQTVYIGCRYDF